MTGGTERELYDLCHYYIRLASNDASGEMATAAADDIRQWLNHHENEAVCLNAATSYVNRFGETGLHDIIQVPELSIEVVLTWLKLAPETARVKSDADWLPLHGACYEAPLNTVMALVEAYPNGLKEKTVNGELPFHCVLHQRQRPLKLDVLNFLLEAYPKSIHDADNLELATYFLNRWIRSTCGYESDDDDEEDSVDCDFYNSAQKRITLLMREVVIGGMHLVAKLFVIAFKGCCSMLDEIGMAPLHYACLIIGSIDMVMVLLDAAPESAAIQDKWGRTPLQLLMPVAKLRDENGMLPLHFQAGHSKSLTVSFLKFLIAAYPMSIHVQDNQGILPVQYAFTNKSLSIEVIMYFIQISPEIFISLL